MRESRYHINQAAFIVRYGDITQCDADVIVSSDDNYLSMGGGVSYAISKAAGATLAMEARKHIPAALGDVVVTSGGKLRSKFVFHAVTIDHDTNSSADEKVIASATSRCLMLARDLKLRSVVFPALGTGVAGFPFQQCANSMVKSVVDFLTNETDLDVVTITLFAREGVQASDLNLFYEHAVAQASVLSGKKTLMQLVGELRRGVEPMKRMDLQRKLDEFSSLLARSAEHVNSNEYSLSVDANSIVDATKKAAHETNWDIRELDMTLTRTRLAGCLAQLNIKTSHLQRFEVEKAKHGGMGVPPRLDVAISEIQGEIHALEQQEHDLRMQLARLR